MTMHYRPVTSRRMSGTCLTSYCHCINLCAVQQRFQLCTRNGLVIECI